MIKINDAVLQSSNDTSMLVNETFEQRTDYVKFAGYQAAMTYAVGKMKAALKGLGLMEKALDIAGAKKDLTNNYTQINSLLKKNFIALFKASLDFA